MLPALKDVLRDFPQGLDVPSSFREFWPHDVDGVKRRRRASNGSVTSRMSSPNRLSVDGGDAQTLFVRHRVQLSNDDILARTNIIGVINGNGDFLDIESAEEGNVIGKKTILAMFCMDNSDEANKPKRKRKKKKNDTELNTLQNLLRGGAMRKGIEKNLLKQIAIKDRLSKDAQPIASCNGLSDIGDDPDDTKPFFEFYVDPL